MHERHLDAEPGEDVRELDPMYPPPRIAIRSGSSANETRRRSDPRRSGGLRGVPPVAIRMFAAVIRSPADLDRVRIGEPRAPVDDPAPAFVSRVAYARRQPRDLPVLRSDQRGQS